MASFRSQYGVRLSRDLHDMSWREFRAYISGLDGRTPLGRVISIRAEDDPEQLKHFTPEMRKIRNQWRTRRAKQMKASDMEAFLESMKNAFISMAGAVVNEEAGETDVNE